MRRHGKLVGRVVICCGIMVILSLILPPSFWWFMLGVVLICLGATISKRC